MDTWYLSDTFQDTITGFTGTAVAVGYYLNSEPSVCLERLDNDGNKMNQEWVSLSRLKKLGKGVYETVEIHP